MFDGLYYVDAKGNVKHRYFGDALEPSQSLLTLIRDEDHSTVHGVLNEGKKVSINVLNRNEQKVYIRIKPINKGCLVFLSDHAVPASFVKPIEQFMNVISIDVMQMKSPHNKSDFFFNQIQKLNNELVNKTRETEKMNQQLNHLNKILNDRLIKDPLTGLTSRYQYRDEMMLAINLSPKAMGVFCFIDVDNFKDVNDQYGHQTGDKYLITFAKRLQKININPKIAMRISGDEFGLYFHGYDHIDDKVFENIWDQISKHVMQPIIINDVEHLLSFSAGFAVYGKDTKDIHLMIEYADFAMYQAKRSGKNRYIAFDHSIYLREKT